MKSLYTLYEGNQLLIMFCIMIIFFYPLFIIIKTILLPFVSKLIENKGKRYAVALEKNNLSNHIIRIFLAIYLVFCGDILAKSGLIPLVAIRVKDIIITAYVIVTITSLLLTIINITEDLYNSRKLTKKIAIGLHTQILRIFVVACGILAIFSLVIGIPISSLFASIGAATALLTFIFKDTVLGLIASLQLTFQNIIQVGDYVTLPQYNADGTIQKITITVVVIRNFDNSYTTIPISAFLTTGVKNLGPMFDTGGRRIKRAISLDMDTVSICDQKELNAIKKLPYMLEFAKENMELFSKENQITNLSMFRYYIGQYLRNNQNIHQEGFTFLVRTLDPTPTGIPMELYVFTKDTESVNYEEIQATIFEHLLGMLPFFKLKAFQSLCG